MIIGEVSALLAAALWAAGSLLYSQIRLSAVGISFGKNVIATLVLFIHLGIQSAVVGTPMFQAVGQAWLWLGLSGIVGIVVGDTFYFRSLQILGPRRALIVSTTSPVFAALGGWFFLAEAMSAVTSLGITLTLFGVAGVVSDRKAATESPGLFPGSTVQGVVMGLAGALFSGLGAVASRFGLRECDALEGSLIRILVSAVCGFCIVVAARQFRSIVRTICQPIVLKAFLPAVLCGTWLGIWLSQIAYKQSASVAIAMTLLSTTPLFATPMVRVIYGIRITPLGLISTLIAVAGIFITVN